MTAMHSKNDVFTTDWSIRPPPSIKLQLQPLNVQQPPRQLAQIDSSKSNNRVSEGLLNPDTAAAAGRAGSPAPATIKPSDALEVRLLPKHELGHGRHATVHLALYREGNNSNDSPSKDSSKVSSSRRDKTWKVCAAKRFAAGKESQVAGLSEALMLTRLAKCPQVLHYIGLKDDRPLSRPSSSRENSSSTDMTDTSETTADDSAESLLEPESRPPLLPRSHSNTSISTPSSPALKPSADGPSLPTLFSLQQRQPDESSNKATSLRRNATVKAPSQLSHSSRRKPLSISTNDLSEDAPRMLLLTEYCHLGNLAIFILHHGEQFLGRKMFFKFAIDLMNALVAVHEKNIIHGDVKPQNCMIDASFNLKLGDFSSSLFNHPDLVDGIGLGTTQYSSPEIVQMPPSPFSFPIDIFSAGLTLLFMITGVQPYEALTMSSSSRSDRFNPKSPNSPRNTPGNVTPTTSSMSSKRKYRSSSGAGKIVELHVHLSKGHAWEWEERRRLQELEDDFLQEPADQSSPPSSPVPTSDSCIPLDTLNHTDCLPLSKREKMEAMPEYAVVPPELLEPPCEPAPHRSMETYSDHHTPIQRFLHGGAVVPEELRRLVRQMLDPQASNRPTAVTVLEELQKLQRET